MPYNVERLLLLASNLNTDLVSSIMSQFDASKAVNIPNDLLGSVKEMIKGSSIRLLNKLCLYNYNNYIYIRFIV